MNHRYICLFLIVSSLTTWIESRADEQHQITVNFDSNVVLFGAPVEVTIQYRNLGQTPWKLLTPNESTKVAVRLHSRQSELDNFLKLGKAEGYPLDMGETTGVVIVESVPTVMEISPGKSYSFRKLIHAPSKGLKWIESPGIHEIWVDDRNEKILSLRKTLLVVFAEETVSLFAQYTADPDGIQRFSYEKWLQPFDPSLDLNWWYRDDPRAVREKKEAAIQARMKEFNEFWKRCEQSAEMQSVIDEINQESGLPRNARELLRKELERAKHGAVTKQKGIPSPPKRASPKVPSAGDEG